MINILGTLVANPFIIYIFVVVPWSCICIYKSMSTKKNYFKPTNPIPSQFPLLFFIPRWTRVASLIVIG